MMETTVDKLGRVVIPKPVRRRLGLRPGTLLRIEETGEELRLRPVEPGARLIKEENVTVVTGVQAVADPAEMVHRDREERIRKVSGLS
jgi:AbrB family looped-hinge helix DNA binding protein